MQILSVSSIVVVTVVRLVVSMVVEKNIHIKGKKKLTGELGISGAKNAVLKQMILPILSEGDYKIDNVPDIADVYYMQEVLEVLGINSKLEGKTLSLASPSDISIEAPYEVVQKMRASIIVEEESDYKDWFNKNKKTEVDL